MRTVLLLMAVTMVAAAQPALVAPYAVSAGTGATYFGTAAATDTSIDYIIAGGNEYRIREAGNILKARFYIGDASNIVNVYLVLWRLSSGTTYNRIAISQGVKPFAFEVNTLVPGSTMSAAIGDYIGLRVELNAGHAASENVFSAQASAGTSHTYYQLNQPSPATLNTATLTDLGALANPVQIYMARPFLAAIGDSIIGRVASMISEQAIAAGYDPVAYMSANYGNFSWQNMGIPGQTTTQIQARFASDCVALHPVYCLIEGGVNDVAGAVSTAAIVANWTAELSAAQAAGIKPIMILILPWTNGTIAQNTQVDSINAQLVSLAPSYGASVIDARCTVGQFRAGGTTNNCWDIQPGYSAGDGVHYNPSGQQAWANQVVLTLHSFNQSGGLTLGGGAVQQ